MLNGRACRIPKEVLLMHKAAGEPVTVGKSAAVSILDWYDLDQEVLLVMERPVPSTELLRFIKENCGPMAEDVAKVLELFSLCELFPRLLLKRYLTIISFSGECLAAITTILHLGPITTNILNSSIKLFEIHSRNLHLKEGT